MILLFANNAKTTLAASLTSTSTTISLAPTTGALFPNPSAGQYFILTLNDAATGQLYEIVWVTARTGDTLTVVRGQEGTAAKAWLAGDYASCYPTAGTMEDMIQIDQLQDGTYTTTTAAGTANALTATITSNLTSIPNGFSFTVISTSANTGPATLTLTLQPTYGGTSTVLSSYPIYQNGNMPLVAGNIPINWPMYLVWSTAYMGYILTNPYDVDAGNVGITQVQSEYYIYGTATGGSDAITVTVPAGLTSLTDGAIIVFKATTANTTTTPTLAVTYGSTTTAATPIVKWGNTPLQVGDIGGSGYIVMVVYNSTIGKWEFLNPIVPTGSSPVTSFSAGTTGLTPATASTGAITLGGTLNPSNGGTGATTTPIAGALPIGNGTNFTITTLTGGTGIGITNGNGSITLANTGVLSIISGASTYTGNVNLGTTAGFQFNLTTGGFYFYLPNGVLVQGGSVGQQGGTTATYPLPIAFPHAAGIALASKGSAISPTQEPTVGIDVSTTSITITDSNTASGTQGIHWIAIGD